MLTLDDPFTLFGLAPTFHIDESLLAPIFYTLQRTVHPDRYQASAPQERRQAAQQAAAVNEAYQILRDPLRRARYLLTRRGIDLTKNNTLTDSHFLLEQISFRERLSDLAEISDPIDSLRAIQETLQCRRAILITDIDTCFTLETDASLAQAAELVRRLEFFERLIAETKRIEEEKFTGMS